MAMEIMSMNGKNVHSNNVHYKKNAHGKNVKEEKRPHKGGKNGYSKNVHVNNVQENASINEESDKSKVWYDMSTIQFSVMAFIKSK